MNSERLGIVGVSSAVARTHKWLRGRCGLVSPRQTHDLQHDGPVDMLTEVCDMKHARPARVRTPIIIK